MFSPGVTMAMVAIEFIEAGSSTISKAAMSKGMSIYVYTVYSNAFALLILLPSSFIFYRKTACSPLTVSSICKIFLLGILSCCAQTLISMGIRYGSPTLASAIIDLTPAITFLLAIFSRMEKVDLRLPRNQAKSIGTVLSIAGALIVTLYKGPPINAAASGNSSHGDLLLSLPPNWVFGGICGAAGALCVSLIYIVQVWILNDFPEVPMITLIACFFVTGQSVLVALFAERKPNAWTLRPDMELTSIVFTAIFVVLLRSLVHTWVCGKKGAVYASAFKPLQVVIAVFTGVSFLGDTLYVGSVIGAIILVSGFYGVIWGKSQEEEMVGKGEFGCEAHSPKVPLLQNNSMEM